MKKEEVVDRILSERIVAILRMRTSGNVMELVDAIYEGGIRILEITSNTPDYTRWIERAKKNFPQVIIGAGTILTPAQAQEAIASGAQFLVTPNTNPKIIETAAPLGIPTMMGAFTPTEVAKAHFSGADIVKLFPASIGGISYMQAIMGPLDAVKIFAVGGIGSDNMVEWLNAGASGIGLGSSLVATNADGQIDYEQTKTNAAHCRQLLSLG